MAKIITVESVEILKSSNGKEYKELVSDGRKTRVVQGIEGYELV